MKSLQIFTILTLLIFSVLSTPLSPQKQLALSKEEPNKDVETINRGTSMNDDYPSFPRFDWPTDFPKFNLNESFPSIFDRRDKSHPSWWPWKDLEALEKKILDSIPKIPTPKDIGGIDDSFFAGIDPSKVKNETKHDKKIVDGHVIETDEKSIQSGDENNRRVFVSKSVIIYPKDKDQRGAGSDSLDNNRPNNNLPETNVVKNGQSGINVHKLADPTISDTNKDVEVVSRHPQSADVDRNDLSAYRTSNNPKKAS